MSYLSVHQRTASNADMHPSAEAVEVVVVREEHVEADYYNKKSGKQTGLSYVHCAVCTEVQKKLSQYYRLT